MNSSPYGVLISVLIPWLEQKQRKAQSLHVIQMKVDQDQNWTSKKVRANDLVEYCILTELLSTTGIILQQRVHNLVLDRNITQG